MFCGAGHTRGEKLKCPECDFKVTEDHKACPFCKVKLWAPKTLREWNRMEILIE